MIFAVALVLLRFGYSPTRHRVPIGFWLTELFIISIGAVVGFGDGIAEVWDTLMEDEGRGTRRYRPGKFMRWWITVRDTYLRVAVIVLAAATLFAFERLVAGTGGGIRSPFAPLLWAPAIYGPFIATTWAGAAFAVASVTGVTLAEIVTASSTGFGAAGESKPTSAVYAGVAILMVSIAGAISVARLRRRPLTSVRVLPSSADPDLERQTEFLLQLQRDLLTELRAGLSSSAIAADVVRALERGTSPSSLRASGEVAGLDDAFRVVAELTHSLKTPLAHIESVLMELQLTPSPRLLEPQEVRQMLESVGLAKASLAAFREVTRVSGAAEGWSPTSIQESVIAAHALHSKASGKETMATVDLPDSVGGYSTNYILALMLPLLQNAVEASHPSGEIVVTHRFGSGTVDFMIGNSAEGPVGDAVFYDAGRTTKEGHEGLGVAVVQRLLEARGGGSLHYQWSDGTFSVFLRLPINGND